MWLLYGITLSYTVEKWLYESHYVLMIVYLLWRSCENCGVFGGGLDRFLGLKEKLHMLQMI